MRFFLICILIMPTDSLSAQFFINSGAIVDTKHGSTVYVNRMDVENHGEITHAGDLEVIGNIINSNIWSCDTSMISTISLTSDWSNNLLFTAGVGTVVFNGGNQNIMGIVPSDFYNLRLNGASGIVKTMVVNSSCSDTLYLNDVELATNGNVFTLRNANNPVQLGMGYISTSNNGQVKVIYGANLSGNSLIPLGYGLGSLKFKPIFLVSPVKDSFAFTLYGNSPTLDGRNSNTLQDSLCRVNDNYYYRIVTYGSPLFFGISRNSSEQDFSKLGKWNGLQWDKISTSNPTSLIAFQNLSMNSQPMLRTEYIIQAHEKPYVDAGTDIYLPQNASVQLNPTGLFPNNSTFSWSPSNDMNCSNCLTPIFTMGNAGTYFLTVQNGNSCAAFDSLHIFLALQDVFIPNAFTPNGDLLNERFGPHLANTDHLINLEIFNSWGERIYDGHEHWDGTYFNVPVEAGVYIYIATIQRKVNSYTNLKIIIKGVVTLVR